MQAFVDNEIAKITQQLKEQIMSDIIDMAEVRLYVLLALRSGQQIRKSTLQSCI
jgi:hypothetical protein